MSAVSNTGTGTVQIGRVLHGLNLLSTMYTQQNTAFSVLNIAKATAVELDGRQNLRNGYQPEGRQLY